MEVITLSHPHELKKVDCPPTSIALGYFDGVHKGHQKVINTAKQNAKEKGLESAVMTFFPHPSVVLGKVEGDVQYITPIKQKIEIISSMGINRLYIVNFDKQFAELLPQQFIDQYIIDLNIKHVVAGFDFHYGRMGRGTMETILFHSRNEFDFTTVDKFAIDKEKVSSTLIRQYILSGKVQEVSDYLGRFYSVLGNVIHGEKRGRTIGFPTANIDVNDEFLLPKVGVYAVKVTINENTYNGVCNVGFKPTFHNNSAVKPNIEVHIMDFDEDIYDKEVKIEWRKRLRNEKKFNSVEELISQIKTDKEQAIEYFLKGRPC